MERRDFLKKATAVGAAVGLAACGGQGATNAGGSVASEPRLLWRLTSSFPRGLDTIYGGAEYFADAVKRLTNGRFEVRCYPAGELVPGLQVLDAVQQGTVQLGHSVSYYFNGKNPALSFDSAVPFGMTSRQQSAWLLRGGGLELMRELFADFNIVNFPTGNTGAQMGGWFREEVNGLADLKGLKMRIPGQGGEVMSRLGVTVQVLAGGDIYPALERGAIDATEWVGPYDDEKLGFHKIAKNYYYPGWWEAGPSMSLYVNKQAWESLPASYQAVIEVAANATNTYVMADYDAKNPPALTRLLAQGVKLRAFSPEIMEAARRESEALLAEQAAANAGYRKVYEAWKKFRDESYAWFATAEQSYGNFAFGKP